MRTYIDIVSEGILLEYRLDKTLAVFGDKIATELERTGLGEVYPDAESLVRHLESYDPTPNKEYMPWIVKIYVSYGLLVPNDKNQCWNALTSYHRMKIKKKFKTPELSKYADINWFRTLRQLTEFILSLGTSEKIDPQDIEVKEKDVGHAISLTALYDGMVIGTASLMRLGTDKLEPHGAMHGNFRRTGLARRFFDLANQIAAREGRQLVKPPSLSPDGEKAWRGRNFFRGALAEGWSPIENWV